MLSTDLERFLNRVDFYGPVYFGSSNDQTGQISFYNSSSKNATTFQAGNATTASTYTWPVTVPSASGYQLVSTTGGVLSWTNALKGTSTNDNASAGNVGEYISSTVGATSFPSSTHFGDLTSIALTAGDWDVSGVMLGVPNGATWTEYELGISQTTGDSTTGLVDGDNRVYNLPSNSTVTSLTIPSYRVSLASSATVYLKFEATYSAGTPKGYGRISARRQR